jgi:tRNA pseudouridine38-40 synthase
MRLALLIEYDGTRYCGWQRQSNGVSIQEKIEHALTQTYGHACVLHGSGRTDAGVHGFGQTAHTVLDYHANRIPLHKVTTALNTRLPDDIRIRKVAEVPDTFHARYDAIWREYRYLISTSNSVFLRHYSWQILYPFDLDRLSEALSIMQGAHDFTAFSKHNPSTQSYICNVQLCEIAYAEKNLEIRIRANRFVYGMCRAIIGAAVETARGGSTSLSDLRLRLESKTRIRAPYLAPAKGLRLEHVAYSNDPFTTL